MNELYPGLPAELEDDWIDALGTGVISGPLARFLADHPDAQAELASLDDVATALRRDRDAAHPGAHYFDALESDIMAGLSERAEQRSAVRDPAPLVGRKVEPGAASGASWWSSVWAWFGAHPTMAWGAVMALALVAILAWPSGDEPAPGEGIAVTGPDAGEIVAPAPEAPEPEKADWLAAALPSDLSQDELLELRQIAAQVELGSLEDSDGLDDDWGLGVGAGAIQDMGAEELDSALDALEAPL